MAGEGTWGNGFGLLGEATSSLHAVRLELRKPPLEVFSRLCQRCDYAYLLESVEGPERLAEYSFIGFNPRAVVTVKGGEVRILREDEEQRYRVKNPLLPVRQLVGACRANNGFRFTGGAVGYLSYDAVRYWERLPKKAAEGFGFPEVEMAIYDDGFAYNHKTGEAFYYYTDRNRLEEAEAMLRDGCNVEAPYFSSPKANLGREEFEDIVVKSKEYIASGDVFQVVVSRRYDISFRGSLIPFYEQLRCINPSPYMFFLKMGRRQIVGSSPEMLMRVEGRVVETYPIAGTRPRFKDDPAKDKAMEEELINNPKERAEHVMLVDLARNDIGKVAELGSVHVSEFMVVHKYSHVQHIVSRVVGRLRSDCSPYDALKALFPAGTVSGAPKIRAMEIIEELEPARRGPYAGAVGYFSTNGNADFAITIRSLVADGRRGYMQAGAGIVADSTPEVEWAETEHKLSALLRALKMASEGGCD
ncbi:MAG: anthranilate synthase component I [Candidatus Nezhaarchaeota archaeon]|nr:anthranilate synthase component I [Candidatus Nezhaarchaeota archaeon]